jgi:2-polyprenyl-6-methoxyphenol hydroxylase-like FAD-dependent oxidoreductase
LKSFVARSVGAEQYNERPRQLCGYYSYWSGLPMHGRFETYIRGDRGFAAAPTNDDLTLVVGGWPYAEFEANKRDIEGHYLEMFAREPSFAERISKATRETRVTGTAVPNFFRKPFGPGWALVGDAGYNRDFITAQGISDAFHDAEVCADAIDDALAGRRDYAQAMADYQRSRDERVSPMYDFTVMLASFEEPPEELQQLLAAVSTNQESMDGFARVNAGVTSPAEFFAPDNVARIFAAA